MNIIERIERWYTYMTVRGVKLKHIAVHPSDYIQAPSEFKGVPIVCLGLIKNG